MLHFQKRRLTCWTTSRHQIRLALPLNCGRPCLMSSWGTGMWNVGPTCSNLMDLLNVRGRRTMSRDVRMLSMSGQDNSRVLVSGDVNSNEVDIRKCFSHLDGPIWRSVQNELTFENYSLRTIFPIHTRCPGPKHVSLPLIEELDESEHQG